MLAAPVIQLGRLMGGRGTALTRACVWDCMPLTCPLYLSNVEAELLHLAVSVVAILAVVVAEHAVKCKTSSLAYSQKLCP